MSREARLLLIVVLAAAVFRLPGLSYPQRGVLRRGLSREDGAPVPARRGAHGVGASPDGEAADRRRCRRLRLRAVGLAARAGARRHPARARVPAAGAARARDGTGGAARDRAAAVRRRLPRAEPDRDDQRLRRAVPAAVRAAAARARCSRSASRCARWRSRGSRSGSRSRRAGRACGPGASSASCFLAVRRRRGFAPRELALGALAFVALPALVYLLELRAVDAPGTQRGGRPRARSGTSGATTPT